MKRFSFLVLSLVILGLSSCAPRAAIENNVQPSIFSLKVVGNTLNIQGRYFDDGMSGQAQDSYVIIGGDVNGFGGVTVKPTSWSGRRIKVTVPDGAQSGFVFVVVKGIRSNGLPANIQ